MIIVNLLLIAVIVCFIVDCSGVVYEFKKFISRILTKKFKLSINPDDLVIKPFDCSLCMTWWSGLIYLIIIQQFTLPYIAFVAFLALIASNISGLMMTIKDYLAAFEIWLEKLISK